MVTEITWGTGFESGNPIPAADYYVIGATPEPVIEVGVSKTGNRSLKGNVAPSATCWVRKDVSSYAQPATSVYIYPRGRYYEEIVPGDEEHSLPNIHFSFGQLHQYVFRWDGYNRTMSLYWRYYDSETKKYVNTLLDIGSVKVSQNDFFNLQVWASMDFIRAKIDGHLSISREAGPLYPGYTHYDYVYLEAGYYSVSSEGTTGNFDDWIIGHGGWIGDVRVDDLRPVADSSVAFTPINPLNYNYQEIDEIVADDNDYNYASVNGLVDKLEIESYNDTTPEGVTKVIRAVEPWVRARIDAATGDHIKVGLDSNAIEDVTQHALKTSYQCFEHCTEVDPNTSAAWTKVGLDASLLMYKSVIG